MHKPSCYQLIAVADRDGQSRSGRNVVFTMLKGMTNLLHNLVILPYAGCLSMMWLHNPVGTCHPQRRSKILLAISGTSTAYELLDHAINCIGYRFEKSDLPHDFPLNKLKNNCDITRLHVINTPSVSKEFNPDILPGYFDVYPFKNDEGNDFSILDNFLAGVTKPVMWSLSVERFDTLAIYRSLARYSEYLSAVNSGRIDSSGFIAGRKSSFRFDKHKDPLADETRRNISRLLCGNRGEVLSFTIRTFAPSSRLAQLLAAVLAGSCLNDGSYDIHPESINQKRAIKGLLSCKHILPDISLKTNCSATKSMYLDLKPLLNIALPQELSSFFRLPIGSESFRPQCLVCDTDPPAWSMDEILPLGREVIDHA